MWNSELYNKTLKKIKEKGSFRGYSVKSKEKLYLLLAYPKNKQEDLTSEQRRIIKELVDKIKKE